MKRVNVSVLGYGFIQSVFHMPHHKEVPEASVIAVGTEEGAFEEFINSNGKELGRLESPAQLF